MSLRWWRSLFTRTGDQQFHLFRQIEDGTALGRRSGRAVCEKRASSSAESPDGLPKREECCKKCLKWASQGFSNQVLPKATRRAKRGKRQR